MIIALQQGTSIWGRQQIPRPCQDCGFREESISP
jgi:hypothetical protein